MRSLLVPGVSLQQHHNRLRPARSINPVLTSDGVSLASTRSTITCTASATPHTKGAWSQIIASASTDLDVVGIALNTAVAVSATDTAALLDIGIGDAGSEVVVVPNLNFGFDQAWRQQWVVPVHIPAGSRVACRCQSVVASATIACIYSFGSLRLGMRSANQVVDIGTNLAASRGTVLTVPGAVNTESAWTLLGTADRAYGALMLGLGAAGNTAQSNATSIVDIGTGPADGSNPTAIVSDVAVSSTTAEALEWKNGPFVTYPADVPTGAGISVRWQRGGTMTLDAIVYGVPRR